MQFIKKLKIWEVNGEYIILHFACNKNCQTCHYQLKNHYNNHKNYIKGLLY